MRADGAYIVTGMDVKPPRIVGKINKIHGRGSAPGG
jgi:hypothetical protein